MYTGRTTEAAVRKWQRDALNGPLITLSRVLGIDLNKYSDLRKWYPEARTEGAWSRERERDRIIFVHPTPVVKIVRRIHDIIPDGKLNNDLAIADTAGPNDYDSEETLSWSIGTSARLTHTTSTTHGWSITTKLGFEAGTENNKVTGGLELGAFGEYSQGRAEDKEKSLGSSKSTKIGLPAGDIARLMQTVQSGKGIAKVEDRIILDIQFEVWDYKKRIRGIEGRLKGHAGYRGTGHKRRVHWTCIGAEDLRSTFTGTNHRHPSLRGRNFYRDQSWVRRAVDWMMNEDNRTIKVKSEAHFDVSIFSNSRVVRLGTDGELLEDREV